MENAGKNTLFIITSKSHLLAISVPKHFFKKIILICYYKNL